MKVWTAVWEWNDRSGDDPEVFVATTKEGADRAAFRYMQGVIMDGDGDLRHDDLPGWLAENPPVRVWEEDPAQVSAWLAGFKEATTVPWLTVAEEAVEVIGS